MVVPTGRHGLPADVVAHYQRERLLAATIAEVGERGYRATTVESILKAARVGYVAFDEVFGAKEACLLAAFERIVEETDAELLDAVSAEPVWSGQICAALARLVELLVADRQRARFALIEVEAAGQAACAVHREALDRAIPKLREGRALRRGPAPPGESLEQATIGAVAWLLRLRLLDGSVDAASLLAEVVQAALGPYLGEAEAGRIAAARARNLPPGARRDPGGVR